MARKKKDGGGGAGAPWLNTFADLMNLLLCFFVLLFALSDVNSEKFEQISISMANSIGVFEGGGSSIGSGQLISSGMSQLNELDEFFSSMGKSVEGNTDPADANNTEQGTEDSSGAEGIMNNSPGSQGIEGSEGSQGTGGQGSEGSQGQSQNRDIGLNEAINRIKTEMAAESSNMYDRISDLAEQYSLGDYIEISMDPDYQFVEIVLKGSVLYASGSAEIKEVAEPIMTKIGELLMKFNGYKIEIVGHTDNVPMNSSAFKDNNWLSSARALNAAEYLIDNCGIDPATLKYSGRGEYEPVSSNATAAGRAKNRRIEIKIYNQLATGH